MHPAVALLADEDMRSLAGVDIVVTQALKDSTVIPQLVACLNEQSPALRMRAADALQKIHMKQPDIVEPHASDLYQIFLETTQQEVRWNIGQLLPRMPLINSQVKSLSVAWQSDVKTAKSSLVRTAALQCLYELSLMHPAYKKVAAEAIDYALAHGTPAMQARARHLQ